MTKRYLGAEDCTSPEQVVRYLEQNYVDSDGKAMPTEAAREIAKKAAVDIREGIDVFHSYVRYLGDKAVEAHGGGQWTELEEPEYDEDEDDDA